VKYTRFNTLYKYQHSYLKLYWYLTCRNKPVIASINVICSFSKLGWYLQVPASKPVQLPVIPDRFPTGLEPVTGRLFDPPVTCHTDPGLPGPGVMIIFITHNGDPSGMQVLENITRNTGFRTSFKT